MPPTIWRSVNSFCTGPLFVAPLEAEGSLVYARPAVGDCAGALAPDASRCVSTLIFTSSKARDEERQQRREVLSPPEIPSRAPPGRSTVYQLRSPVKSKALGRPHREQPSKFHERPSIQRSVRQGNVSLTAKSSPPFEASSRLATDYVLDLGSIECHRTRDFAFVEVLSTCARTHTPSADTHTHQ